jgi:hypothetical protein
MAKITLPNTTKGKTNPAVFSDVYENDAAIIKVVNGEIESENIKNGTIEDSDLVSPNNASYRTIFAANSQFSASKAAGTYVASEEAQLSGNNLGGKPLSFFYFAKADYEVTGRTQKLRLRAQIGTNATKPAFKFTVGLYPIASTSGGGSEFKATLGTVVSGSTVEFSEPAASGVTSKETADFSIPPDGAYVFGFVTSAESTALSYERLSFQLQTHSV